MAVLCMTSSRTDTSSHSKCIGRVNPRLSSNNASLSNKPSVIIPRPHPPHNNSSPSGGTVMFLLLSLLRLPLLPYKAHSIMRLHLHPLLRQTRTKLLRRPRNRRMPHRQLATRRIPRRLSLCISSNSLELNSHRCMGTRMLPMRTAEVLRETVLLPVDITPPLNNRNNMGYSVSNKPPRKHTLNQLINKRNNNHNSSSNGLRRQEPPNQLSAGRRRLNRCLLPMTVALSCFTVRGS